MRGVRGYAVRTAGADHAAQRAGDAGVRRRRLSVRPDGPAATYEVRAAAGTEVVGGGDCEPDPALGGSGELRLAGTADALHAELHGSGALAAVDLVTRSATVVLSGSGGAEVHAREQVVATADGSGSVRHAGGAKDVEVHGSGSVAPL